MKGNLSKHKLLYLLFFLIIIFFTFFTILNETENTDVLPTENSTNTIFPVVENQVLTETNTSREEPVSNIKNIAKKIKDGVADGLFISDEKLFFTDRATGNVFSYKKGDEKPKRLTNTTITAVYESYFGREGDTLNVLSRYLSNNIIQNFSGSVSKNSSSTEEVLNLKGSIIPGDIPVVSVSPDKTSLFFLERSDNGVTGYTSDFSGKNRKIVFESPFSEWLPLWIEKSTVSLQTKPSIGIEGFLYYLNTVNGSLEKVLGGINGLSALPSHDNKKVLYSQSQLGSFRSFIHNDNLPEPIPLSVQLIPEKCIWKLDSSSVYCAIPNELLVGDFPDPWYRGEKTFSDNIWKINGNTGETFILFAPEIDTNGSVSFDAITPVLDEKNSMFYFIDKKDSSLWSLDLTGLE